MSSLLLDVVDDACSRKNVAVVVVAVVVVILGTIYDVDGFFMGIF
jgi:hypothetical protein